MQPKIVAVTCRKMAQLYIEMPLY